MNGTVAFILYDTKEALNPSAVSIATDCSASVRPCMVGQPSGDLMAVTWLP
jgi:hypothetical protein